MDHSWASEPLVLPTPAAFDTHAALPWPLGYAQDSEEMAISPSYGRDMGSSFVNRPRSVASWHDPDTSTAAAHWLAGIAQVEPQGSIVHQSTTRTPDEHPTLTKKRRMQNREAQRRFRKKREEQEKLLLDKISDLEAKCNILRESLKEKSGEGEFPLREKRELEAQVRTLRQQEQLLLRLLREQKGGLLESFVSQGAIVSSSSAASPGSSQVEANRATGSTSQHESGSLLLAANSNKIM
ncbi:hypothetical protein BJX66DRAFT_341978 [Aspergillus keveii]|uniref:BZIP domain-containing protein n=1 Tax=Aspergillus keveii TaxID=714993 RepID=A0ABR4FTW5_9EURO